MLENKKTLSESKKAQLKKKKKVMLCLGLSTLTLSKREIFMAFIVAESTKMGGPSSNTSLMNSLAWFGANEKKKKWSLMNVSFTSWKIFMKK